MENASESRSQKIWRERPPGPEQMLLEEMFESGCIADYATPETVRQSCSVFKEFTPKVFAAHYRKTKARKGEFLATARGIPGGVVPPSPPTVKSAMSKIPELGSNCALPPAKRQHVHDLEAPTQIINPPHMTWKHTDHDLKMDYVCVAVNIFTGSKSISFDISEDGLKIIVKFSWPTALFNPAEMFAEELNDGTSKHHPMIHGMSSEMLNTGITENSKPEGQWVIPLPCKVRREITSYSMSKIVSRATKIMFLRFTAYQNDLIIDHANRTLTFD